MDPHPPCHRGTDLIGIQDNALNLRGPDNIVGQGLDGSLLPDIETDSRQPPLKETGGLVYLREFETDAGLVPGEIRPILCLMDVHISLIFLQI